MRDNLLNRTALLVLAPWTIGAVFGEPREVKFGDLTYQCELERPAGTTTAVVVSLHGYNGGFGSTPKAVREEFLKRGWAVCRPLAHKDTKSAYCRCWQ